MPSRPRERVRIPVIAAMVVALVGLTACSTASVAQGRDDAQAACSAPAPSLPADFDVRTAPADEMSALAESAAGRKYLAEEAAASDDRWQVLADAASAIASFAGVLRDARSTGQAVDDVVTADMWNQYKYASDAFVLECQDALAASR